MAIEKLKINHKAQK